MTKRTEKTLEYLDTLLQFKCSYLASPVWPGWQGKLKYPIKNFLVWSLLAGTGRGANKPLTSSGKVNRNRI